jgi:rhodanese-related sulfurtransferase
VSVGLTELTKGAKAPAPPAPSRVDEMVAQARSRIVRYSPAEAAAAEDILLVDLRSVDERERTGIIPGSRHVPRSVLEWRADPTSESHDPTLAGRRLVLVCGQGYSSSLAAASLVQLGVDAGDLEGGFEAWTALGLPVQ